jgi:hypothetical protein
MSDDTASATGASGIPTNALSSSEQELREPPQNHLEALPLMKETRQVQADHAQPVDESTRELSVPAPPPAIPRQASPWRNLKWKQFVAASVMLVLISVFAGLVEMRSTTIQPPPPPPPLPLLTQPAALPSLQTTQPPAARLVNMKNTPVQPSSPSAPSPTRTAAKPPRRPAQPPQETNTVLATSPDQQEEKKGSKVGGFFKKVGGGMKKIFKGGDENQKDTNKTELSEEKEKKP